MASDHGILFVHAHPDDEAIETGATMALYAAAGHPVTLVTCTLGELGEVIPPELAHLEGAGEALARHRERELAAACAALGVADHRLLGGRGRWRDSGMAGLASNDAPGCFWRADLAEAAAALAAVIREVRPAVVVSYDERGYYGHPDHIQAHRVTQRAVAMAASAGTASVPVPPGAAGTGTLAREESVAGQPWRVAKVYATAMPASVLAGLIRLDAAADSAGFRQVGSLADLPFGIPDTDVTTVVDATAHLPAKTAAMAAHATQIAVAGEFFALSDLVGRRINGREHYALLAGRRGRCTGPHGWEPDLFAGL